MWTFRNRVLVVFYLTNYRHPVLLEASQITGRARDLKKAKGEYGGAGYSGCVDEEDDVDGLTGAMDALSMNTSC